MPSVSPEEVVADDAKVNSHDDDIKDEEISEAEMASLMELFRYSTSIDWMSIIFGGLASFTVGAMQPASVVISPSRAQRSSL